MASSKKRLIALQVTIILLLISLLSGCHYPERGEKVTSEKSAGYRNSILEYYSNQGVITNPGEYEYLYERLPSNVPELVKVVQGILIHSGHAHRYGVRPSEERKNKEEHNIRKIEDMIKRVVELDDRPIVFARQPEKRLLVSCRSFAVLTCSLLRHQSIPARVRGGFETYFYPQTHVNHHEHWICEYWSSVESRWVQIDAQVDDTQKKAMNININTLDLPDGAFLTGGQAWKLCRAGKTDPNVFGVWDNSNKKWLTGWTFVQSKVVLDLMALNKFELLPWDGNALSKTDTKQLNNAEYALLDKVAELTTTANRSFSLFRLLYESEPTLRMPSDWAP